MYDSDLSFVGAFCVLFIAYSYILFTLCMYLNVCVYREREE